jgi:hypothetical protein
VVVDLIIKARDLQEQRSTIIYQTHNMNPIMLSSWRLYVKYLDFRIESLMKRAYEELFEDQRLKQVNSRLYYSVNNIDVLLVSTKGYNLLRSQYPTSEELQQYSWFSDEILQKSLSGLKNYTHPNKLNY